MLTLQRRLSNLEPSPQSWHLHINLDSSPVFPCYSVLSRPVVSNSLWPFPEWGLDYSPPGSPVHGILQGRILGWVAVPSSRGSSWPRDQTQVSHIAGGFFYHLSHQGSPLCLPASLYCDLRRKQPSRTSGGQRRGQSSSQEACRSEVGEPEERPGARQWPSRSEQGEKQPWGQKLYDRRGPGEAWKRPIQESLWAEENYGPDLKSSKPRWTHHPPEEILNLFYHSSSYCIIHAVNNRV